MFSFSSIDICKGCLKSYSNVNQCLQLPCGHEYCKACLEKQTKELSCRNCKACSKSWSYMSISDLKVIKKQTKEPSENLFSYKMPVKTTKNEESEASQFPVNFELSSFKFSSTADFSGKCFQHPDKDLLFWCGSCEVTGCKECLSQKHKKCDWQFIEDSEEDFKQYIDRNRDATCGRMQKTLEDINAKLSTCKAREQLIKKFSQSVVALKTKNKEDTELLEKMKKNIGAELTNAKDDSQNYLKESIEKLLSRIDIMVKYNTAKQSREISANSLWEIMQYYQVSNQF